MAAASKRYWKFIYQPPATILVFFVTEYNPVEAKRDPALGSRAAPKQWATLRRKVWNKYYKLDLAR